MLPPSTSSTSNPIAANVVLRVYRAPDGSWMLEKAGGDVGGIFVSKRSALAYALGEAQKSPSASVVIEVRPAR